MCEGGGQESVVETTLGTLHTIVSCDEQIFGENNAWAAVLTGTTQHRVKLNNCDET